MRLSFVAGCHIADVAAHVSLPVAQVGKAALNLFQDFQNDVVVGPGPRYKICSVGTGFTGPPLLRPNYRIVTVTSGRRKHYGSDGYPDSGQDPGPLARCKAGRQQSVVDFPRDGEAVKRSRGKEQPLIVREAVRWGVDVAFCCKKYQRKAMS